MSRLIPFRARDLGVAAAGLMAAVGLHAQTPALPGAGDVQRALTPPVAPAVPQDRAAPLTPPVAPAAQADAAGPRVHVRAVRLTGVTVLPEADVRAPLDELVGRSWSLVELQRAVARVTRLYQERGYPIARAILPAQDIVDGAIEVRVLEGQVGQVRLENTSRLTDATVARLLGDIPGGSVVRGPELEARLLTLGDIPGTSRASVVLEPGTRTGESDLTVRVDPAPAVTGQLDFDNHGNRYTGYWRAAAQLAWNSPLGLGDQLTARALVTDESTQNLRLGWRVPVARRGVTVGAAYSQVDYQLRREYENLRASGTARMGTVDVAATLARSPGAGLLGRLSWDQKLYADKIAVLSNHFNRKQADVVSASFNGFGTQGATSHAWTAVLSRGKLNLPAAEQVASDSRRTLGYFSKAVLTANLNATLRPGWSVFGSVYGQAASRNLDPSEKMSIGGVNGVRAYPEGEALGDQGVLGTAELRYTLPLQPVQLGLFVDSGHVRFDRFQSAGRHGRTLTGAGLSLVWAPTPDIGLKAMVATRLGDARIETEPESRTRLWVQSVVRF